MNLDNNKKHMDNDNIENIIAEKVQKIIDADQSLKEKDDETRKIIKDEIIAKNYLNEEWQIHYAVDRIFNIVKDPENTCPFCGAEGKNFRGSPFLGGFITFLLPKYRCTKCKKFFPPVLKNPIANKALNFILIILLIIGVFSILRNVFAAFFN